MEGSTGRFNQRYLLRPGKRISRPSWGFRHRMTLKTLATRSLIFQVLVRLGTAVFRAGPERRAPLPQALITRRTRTLFAWERTCAGSCSLQDQMFEKHFVSTETRPATLSRIFCWVFRARPYTILRTAFDITP